MNQNQSPPQIFKKKIKAGDPISIAGLAESLNQLEEAIKNIKVISVKGKRSRIEWVNGKPIIYIDET